MMRKLIIILMLAAATISAGSAQAEVIFEDAFDGIVIDTSKWSVHPGSGSITQINEIVLSAPSNGGWDQTYMTSTPSFSRVSDANSLVVSMDVKATSSMFIIGLFSDGSFTNFASDTQYGFHYNGLLYAMQDGGFYDPITPPSGDFSIRLTLDPTIGALWEYNTGWGWITLRDTRGLSGDTSSNYQLFLEAGSTTAFSADNVVAQHANLPGEFQLPDKIQDLSEHFETPDSFGLWQFDLGTNVSANTSDHPGLLTFRFKDGYNESKGILSKPIPIGQYPFNWEFEMEVLHPFRFCAQAIGLNVEVTFSDPSTWPVDRSQTPPNTRSFQLFLIAEQGDTNTLEHMKYKVYGRGDLDTQGRFLGEWEIPYYPTGDGQVDWGAAGDSISLFF
ncbi:MAG: hypothetical protein DRP56_05630, partial [Planctomycetota bacterium]